MRLRQRGQSNGNRQMSVRRVGHPLDKIRWIVICDIGESRVEAMSPSAMTESTSGNFEIENT